MATGNSTDNRRAGQFKPGQSGNPSGRPKKPKIIETYAKEAPERLYAIATAIDTPKKIQKEIWQFFYEAQYGKAKQAVDVDGNMNVAPVVFTGSDEIAE